MRDSKHRISAQQYRSCSPTLIRPFGPPVPTPFVPSGHFPLTGGIGPQGKAFLVQTCQLSRERSKKTEAVFLVGLRESEGKSKSPQALFLLPAFSFGEAKENAGPQSQICRRLSVLQRSFIPPSAPKSPHPPRSSRHAAGSFFRLPRAPAGRRIPTRRSTAPPCA